MDQKQQDRDQNKDAQKSGEPVQLEKDKKQDDKQGGRQHQGAENR